MDDLHPSAAFLIQGIPVYRACDRSFLSAGQIKTEQNTADAKHPAYSHQCQKPTNTNSQQAPTEVGKQPPDAGKYSQ